MVEANRVQNDLITALSGISQGQSESAKHYVAMDDQFDADGKAAQGAAQGAKTASFRI